MSTRLSLCFAASIALVVSISTARANEADKKAATSSELAPEKAKETVLAWIDDFAEKQVLFHDEDIQRLRKELADDTPEQAQQWWSDTAQIRAALDSPEWQDTREWLKEFLRVQAVYSDEDIARFRDEAKQAANKESPQDFTEILTNVERRRARLFRGSANSRALRDHQVAVAKAFEKETAAARAAAARAAAATSAPKNAGQQVVQRRPRRAAPRPLVDSLDAARWNVMRGFWR